MFNSWFGFFAIYTLMSNLCSFKNTKKVPKGIFGEFLDFRCYVNKREHLFPIGWINFLLQLQTKPFGAVEIVLNSHKRFYQMSFSVSLPKFPFPLLMPNFPFSYLSILLNKSTNLLNFLVRSWKVFQEKQILCAQNVLRNYWSQTKSFPNKIISISW